MKVYEVFFTTDYVEEETWLKFILYVSKLNGRFRRWSIHIKFEKNKIRFFIKVRKDIPTTIGELGDFLIKRIENNDVKFVRKVLKTPYIITNREKNVIDVYDKNESKRKRKLLESKISFLPYSKNNYFSFTKLFFEKKNNITAKKAYLNIPHIFLSINFSNHTRFVHQKSVKKYLNIEKTIDLFESDNKNAVLKLEAFPYFQDNYFLNLSNYDFYKHSLIIGGSGTGKSKLISSFVKNIYDNPEYRNKYKIVIIDPHASLEEDIGGLNSTKVVDFENRKSSIDLFKSSPQNVVSETEIMISLFKNLMAKEYNSKLERVLRHTIFLLILTSNLSLKNMRKLITENEYRNEILKKYKEDVPDQINDFFYNDFNNLKTKSHTEAIAPIISFIDEMEMLPCFTDDKIETSIEQIVKNNFLSIISLAENKIGEKMTQTISGLIMSQLFSLMQTRQIEEHIIFIVDEVGIIQNPILKRFLSESRKFNLSLILSGQYFNQIEDELQKSIFANVINYYTFRVSREDSIILSRNMLMELAIHDSHFAKVKMLSELADRECVLRVSRYGKTLPAIKGRTLDFVQIPRVKEYEITKEEEKTEERNTKSNFSIGEKVSLKKIMESQSTGRRRIVNEG